MSRDLRAPARAVPARSWSGEGRVACVVSEYHGEITGALLDSALESLEAGGVARERIEVVHAPGAFELPVLAQALARRADVAAVLCFGLVLRGETDHDRHIARACSEGLMRVALDQAKPVLFGVLTCATLGQARRRARRRAEGGLDKGREVATACLATLAGLEAIAAGGRA